ncbi:hypothetical protein H4R18_003154 [Coemansia javaensis]|uniref:J domain-containing protein n=1 Tax=Coemansia javaensis TaxID=2761396 RepID=A0A9W8LJ10_9FUNG|nr:hypothetical protein H4R18_003154 [Coemansia javaensis]
MRAAVVVLLCSLLAGLALAWEKLDHEIFELYDDIKKHESTADWYELLGVDAKSGVDEINKAYRQLSRKYHPDKLQRLSAAEGRQAARRFQRMGLVVGILRDSEARKRYNFFRKNGVPVWRGTGYLYRRWRPGFGSVMAGLAVFAAGMQYLFHQLSYWRAQQRIRDIEEHRGRAGGRLKVRREQSVQQSTRRERRRTKAGNRTGSPARGDLEDSGVEGDDMDQLQVNTLGVINPYSVRPASVRRLFVVAVPAALAHAVLVRLGLRAAAADAENDGGGDDDNGKDDAAAAAEGTDGEAHRQAIAEALDNVGSDRPVSAAAADPEAKAKKAARKAAKAQARRRRVPVV